jgi:hypothetical protein
MMRELRGFHPSFCTIWKLPDTLLQDSLGAVKRKWPDDYSVMAGHDAIPCNLAADEGDKAALVEQRKIDTTYVSRPLYAQLDGYYPAIGEAMRAVIDTVTYDIKGVTHSSTLTLTRLALERIE